jgi:hypothetical protein
VLATTPGVADPQRLDEQPLPGQQTARPRDEPVARIVQQQGQSAGRPAALSRCRTVGAWHSLILRPSTARVSTEGTASRLMRSSAGTLVG